MLILHSFIYIHESNLSSYVCDGRKIHEKKKMCDMKLQKKKFLKGNPFTNVITT